MAQTTALQKSYRLAAIGNADEFFFSDYQGFEPKNVVEDAFGESIKAGLQVSPSFFPYIPALAPTKFDCVKSFIGVEFRLLPSTPVAYLALFLSAG